MCVHQRLVCYSSSQSKSNPVNMNVPHGPEEDDVFVHTIHIQDTVEQLQVGYFLGVVHPLPNSVHSGVALARNRLGVDAELPLPRREEKQVSCFILDPFHQGPPLSSCDYLAMVTMSPLEKGLLAKTPVIMRR